MKTAALSLTRLALAVAFSMVTGTRAQAGLAEATDFGGTWTSGAWIYTSASQVDPRGSAPGSSRVNRGGSFESLTPFLLVASRTSDSGYVSVNHGFRLARGRL